LGAIWLRFRAEFRTRWRAIFALALLVGVAGGATLTAVAGARRTDTAFSRLITDTKAWDVLVNPDNGTDSALRSEDVAGLPQVAEAGREDGLFLALASAKSQSDLQGLGIDLVSDGRVGYSFGRRKILEGRRPNPRRAREVAINPLLAEQQHLGVGDRLRVLTFSDAEAARIDSGEFPSVLDALAAARRGEIGSIIALRVAGIAIGPDEIVTDEGFGNPSMFLTPAFRQRYPQAGSPYWGEAVRLRHGAADIPAFRQGVEALVPNEAIAFETLPSVTAKFDRAVRPEVGALAIFAIVIALTGLLVIGQAVARQTFLDSVDGGTIRALGGTRGQLVAVAMLRGALIAGTGAALAVIVAFFASPLMPIGVARTAEPDPGLAFDGVALGLGFLAVAFLTLVLAAVPAWRYSRTRPDGEAVRPSRVAGALAGAGAPVPAVAGVRMALEPGRGRTAVPVRTTIVSSLLAIAMVIGALVVAASLDHLVSTPRLYGWNWDVQMNVSGEDADSIAAGRADVAKVLDRAPSVARWSTISISDLRLPGGSVPAIGVGVGAGAVVPTLINGRIPTKAAEIALGERTARKLGLGVGDGVSVRGNDGASNELTIVGRVVLPGIGTYPGSDKTSLGEGAVVTTDALRRLGPDFGRGDFVVDFRDAASPAARAGVIANANHAAGSNDFEAAGVQKPSDILSYERIRTTPLVLAIVLALLALATVAHALITAVRRRRREFAMLETLGFTRRQVSASVAWQATTVAVISLVVGIPLGIVLGRAGWTVLATDLGIVPEPIVPIVGIVIAVPIVIVLVNLVAFLPGRLASRVSPAFVLRSE
jgi:ABC-type antimicrobial peptide transport system permease subunit